MPKEDHYLKTKLVKIKQALPFYCQSTTLCFIKFTLIASPFSASEGMFIFLFLSYAK